MLPSGPLWVVACLCRHPGSEKSHPGAQLSHLQPLRRGPGLFHHLMTRAQSDDNEQTLSLCRRWLALEWLEDFSYNPLGRGKTEDVMIKF